MPNSERLRAGHAATGIPVDRSGGPTIDPTANVLALVEASNRRQDDLRLLQKEMSDIKHAHSKEICDLMAAHQRALDAKESERLDSIRKVDRDDVNKTAAAALDSIRTLAATTATTAETLRTQVATVAQAAANQRAIDTGETNKRLSALELASSEGKGKQAFSDPMMEKLVSRMDTLLQQNSASSGRTSGSSALWAYVVGAIGAIVGFGSLFLGFMRMKGGP